MSNITIIPKPVSLIITDGFFNLNEKVELLYDSGFYNEASYIKTIFPFKYGKNKNTVHLKKNVGLAVEEYLLSISNNKIIIESSCPKGQMHAIQSLRQLMPNNLKNKFTNP